MRNVMFLSFALTGCQMVAELDSSKVAAAEAAVRATVPNPDGVRFGAARVTKSFVCGEADVMNSFGEYPGFRPYAFRLDTRTAVVMPNQIVRPQDAQDKRDFPKECLPQGK